MSEEVPDLPLMQADETMSPVDLLPEEDLGRPLAWTSLAIAVATLFLFLTNAVTMDGWARELPPSATAEQVVTLTGRWVAFTDRFGLGKPRALLHEQWKKAEAARFQ